MKENYEIERYKILGTQFVEVRGSSFCCEDFFEIVGKDQYMSTFMLKKGSKSYEKFGESVTGVIYYNKNELDVYGNLDLASTENEINDKKIKIDSPMYDFSVAQREELKYGGILIEDIEFLSFMAFKRDKDHYESGEKKVPNIMYIPLGGKDNVDVDILYQNYIVSKIDSQVNLIPYEKEKFIGITLGINDGHIDSRLLDFLGFTIENIRTCKNIWYHVYKTKERKNNLSETEKKKLADLIFIKKTDGLLRIFNEIKTSGVNTEELSKCSNTIKTIVSSALKFEPSILLHGQKQIYWDLDSYIHIVMRHVKQLQLGRFKDKTPFPYKFEELGILIEQVIGQVEHEIKRHFDENPKMAFKRVGRMCVLYNGDYYCVQIDVSGKLVNLYVSGQYWV